jgi:hypothetical protein
MAMRFQVLSRFPVRISATMILTAREIGVIASTAFYLDAGTAFPSQPQVICLEPVTNRLPMRV